MLIVLKEISQVSLNNQVFRHIHQKINFQRVPQPVWKTIFKIAFRIFIKVPLRDYDLKL